VAVEKLSSYREPVRKSIIVKCDAAHAFALFTAGFGRWWPLATHSVSTDRAVDCVIEPRVGGDVYEVRDDGARFSWGRVLEWQPPQRFVLSWHPGMPPEGAQEVELRFTDIGLDGARVDLEHRNWDALGPMAEDARNGYNKGWETVFIKVFADACARAGEDRP
jgi:uncharacterized protein YndB with AHSA1/START domain